MYFIALHILFGDRSKYISMILGLTFSSVIMTQQPAIFLGLITRTYSFITAVSAPDIWVMNPGVQFVEENKPIRSIELFRIRGIPGVAWAVPMIKALMQAKLPDGNARSIDLTGIDDYT